MPCVELPAITYHAPQDQAGVNSLFAGTLPDPENQYDTPDTITQIRKANAARKAVCGP